MSTQVCNYDSAPSGIRSPFDSNCISSSIIEHGKDKSLSPIFNWIVDLQSKSLIEHSRDCCISQVQEKNTLHNTKTCRRAYDQRGESLGSLRYRGSRRVTQVFGPFKRNGLFYVSLTCVVSCQVATYRQPRLPNRLSDRSQSSHSIDWRDICSDDKIHCTGGCLTSSADRSSDGMWSIRPAFAGNEVHRRGCVIRLHANLYMAYCRKTFLATR